LCSSSNICVSLLFFKGIFGSFESFSQILTNPSIRRSHVHGVVPHPITPLIENMPVRSPIEELVDKHSQPGPSTVAVLEVSLWLTQKMGGISYS
jgi:hypothetical protein